MIRVTLAPEPPNFHQSVRLPGERAIRELIGDIGDSRSGRRRKAVATEPSEIPSHQFPDYWTRALDDLMNAYDCICAYSCIRIQPVTGAATVDHMVPKSKAPNLVYEWSNYRLACSRLNARKGEYEDVIDPFEIEDDWFHLEFVGFQIHPNHEIVDQFLVARIEATISRLKLNGFDLRSARKKHLDQYRGKAISFSHLLSESPFLARELRRQELLNPEDATRPAPA